MMVNKLSKVVVDQPISINKDDFYNKTAKELVRYVITHAIAVLGIVIFNDQVLN
jgi:hypothetical protein